MSWNFDNSYARLPDCFFARLNRVPVKAPTLVIFNRELALSLGLSESMVSALFHG